MNVIFDSHCHLNNFSAAELQIELDLAKIFGITKFLSAATNPDEWLALKQIQLLYTDKIIPCYGIHPWHIHVSDTFAKLEKYADELIQQLIANHVCSEVGLDFSPKWISSQENQIYFLQTLFKKINHPIVLHCVWAHEKLLTLIDSHLNPSTRKGVIHGFHGSYELAQQYIKRGFIISIGPDIFHPNRKKFRACVKNLAPSDYCFETDAPRRHPITGQPIQLSDLIEVAKVFSDLRKQPLDEVLECGTQNLVRTLSL